MPTREIPNNQEAEQAVVGAMFLQDLALQKACDSLNKEDFYNDKNAKIFGTIKEMANQKMPIDLTTVTTELKNRNLLGEVGGVEYLTDILDSVPTAANVEYYIKAVEDAALLRKLIEVSTNITTSAYSSDKNVSEVIDSAEQSILNVVKNKRTTDLRPIREVLVDTQRNLELLSKNKGEVTGIATGFTDLDRLTAGLHEGQLVVIAARPGMGKTAIALNIATHVAMNYDKPVALFNLEMTADQLASRMLSSLGQVELSKLQTGNLLNDDWNRVNEAISQLSDAKLYMEDNTSVKIEEIRSKCRRLASSSEGLGLVIIDYLQLITSNVNYGGNRQQEVSDISRSLKKMALELKVPVIALAQLNREADKRENKKPVISDLRESGSIEQDADIVAFLYSDDYYGDKKYDEKAESVVKLLVAKHRQGATSMVELWFKKSTSTFVNYFKTDKEGVPNE